MESALLRPMKPVKKRGTTMKEIKSVLDGRVLFALDCNSVKICVEEGVKVGADLRGADLSEANLSRANLSQADLHGANLSQADLSWADLSWADLSWADLNRADLNRANLSWANLSRANLSWANLSWANLSWANLSRANLSRAKIKETIWPSPPMVLLASWGMVSDKLTIDLMRYDASNHPYPEWFGEWALRAGACPYDGAKIQRSANFDERRSLITSTFLGLPFRSAYDLMQALLKECCKEE